MGQKKTHLDRAIDAINQDIAVLQAAKDRLVQQQQKAATRKPRSAKPAAASER